MAIPVAAVVTGVGIAQSLSGPSQAFMDRQTIRDEYWNTLDKLYDAVKAGLFSPAVREMIWQDWPTYLTSGSAVRVLDPVTNAYRTSTDYGAHAGRTGSEADLKYLKERLAVYDAAERGASGGVSPAIGAAADSRSLAFSPSGGYASAGFLGGGASGNMLLLLGGLVLVAWVILK